MIETIAFDYTGVIAPGPLMTWVKNNLKPESDAYLSLQESSKKWDLGEMSEDEFYLTLSQITGVPADKIWDNFYENSTVNTDVVKVIQNLQKLTKIALFSDNFSPLLRKLLEKNKLSSLFDEIVISSEYGLKKPDPQFFQVLLSQTKTKNENLLFIDDTNTNVQAAKELNIDAILFIGSKYLVEELKQRGIQL